MGGEGVDRGWDGWMASPTQWTWVWVSSGSWWWTGRPGVLQSMGPQRVRHDWAAKLSWMDDSDPWERTFFLVTGNLFFFYSGIFKVFLIPGATHLTGCVNIHEMHHSSTNSFSVRPRAESSSLSHLKRKFSSLISFIMLPLSPPWTPLEWYCFSWIWLPNSRLYS